MIHTEKQAIAKTCHKKQKAHIDDPMCVSIESSSFVAAGFSTLIKQVAGFHRAVPSTTLDKASMQLPNHFTVFFPFVNP